MSDRKLIREEIFRINVSSPVKMKYFVARYEEIKVNQPEHTDFELELEGCEDDPDAVIYGYRKETDEEYHTRQEKEKKWREDQRKRQQKKLEAEQRKVERLKANQTKRDREIYEMLKVKYGENLQDLP